LAVDAFFQPLARESRPAARVLNHSVYEARAQQHRLICTGNEQSVAPLGKSICLIQLSAHPQHESEAVQKQTAQRMQRRIVEQ
jgi:hypothetical protein